MLEKYKLDSDFIGAEESTTERILAGLKKLYEVTHNNPAGAVFVGGLDTALKEFGFPYSSYVVAALKDYNIIKSYERARNKNGSYSYVYRWFSSDPPSWEMAHKLREASKATANRNCKRVHDKKLQKATISNLKSNNDESRSVVEKKYTVTPKRDRAQYAVTEGSVERLTNALKWLKTELTSEGASEWRHLNLTNFFKSHNVSNYSIVGRALINLNVLKFKKDRDPVTHINKIYYCWTKDESSMFIIAPKVLKEIRKIYAISHGRTVKEDNVPAEDYLIPFDNGERCHTSTLEEAVSKIKSIEVVEGEYKIYKLVSVVNKTSNITISNVKEDAKD